VPQQSAMHGSRQSGIAQAVDASLCGIRHTPVIEGARSTRADRVQQLRHWRRTKAQYVQLLQAAGERWRVSGTADLHQLRAAVSRAQQEAVHSAAEQFCASVQRRCRDSSVGAHREAARATHLSRRQEARIGLLCALEASQHVQQCAQAIEDAYIDGAPQDALAAAVRQLARLFAARYKMIEHGCALWAML
jgi:hypothetical protein